MALQFTQSEKEDIINTLVETASFNNQGWYREYMTNNFNALVMAVETGDALKFGFRGLEMKEELQRRGLIA